MILIIIYPVLSSFLSTICGQHLSMRKLISLKYTNFIFRLFKSTQCDYYATRLHYLS